MPQETAKDTVVLYHAECLDGFSAAWAAWKKFGNTAEYIPVYHGKSPPLGLVDKKIYTVDFSYPEQTTRELMANNQLTTIDHHAGSEAVTKLTQDYLFDNSHSGAYLAWQYFHPGQATPRFILNVEDSDLFKFALPDTAQLVTYAGPYLGDFSKWEEIITGVEADDTRKDYIEKGNLLLGYRQSLVKELLNQKQEVLFEGRKIYTVNGPRVFRSEVGHALAKLTGDMGIYWYQEKDRIHVSLRSMPEFDVSAIARKFGGNGHKNAASFYFDAGQPFPWKIIKEKDE